MYNFEPWSDDDNHTWADTPSNMNKGKDIGRRRILREPVVYTAVLRQTALTHFPFLKKNCFSQWVVYLF